MISTGDRRVAVLVVIVPLVFLAIILLVAVTSSNDDLDGTTWRMDSLLIDGSMTPAIEGAPVTVSFDDGTATGFGGCNEYFGEYQLDGNSLTFGDLGSTQAICDDELGTSNQELAYLSLLGSVDGYRVDDGQLILSDGSTDLVELTSVSS